LQGRFWWNKRSKEGSNKGIAYFQQAIQKDPNYALAYAGLADCYIALGASGNLAPKETFPRAEEASRKALEIDDTLAEAHASLAFSEASFDWNWAGADAEFGRAIELNPDNATARDQHGTVLRVAGRREESIAKNKRAVELDPLSVPFRRDLGYAYYDARQYDQAIEQERKTLELDPNFNQARSILGRAYIQEAMYRQGIAEIEKELVISPADPNVLSELGRGYAMASRHAEAQNVIDQLIAVSKRSYVAPKNVAAIYAALGEKDKAFEWLEKAYQDRSLASGITLKSFPGFDSLRSDPRFADLLRRMNLQP